MYLEDGPSPAWLLKQISREAAEQELGRRVGGNGTFLVREKIIAASRVVFALSFKYEEKYRHHLLERPLTGCWKLDDAELELKGPLNEVIRLFQAEKHAGLGSVLAPDAPEPPPRAPKFARRDGTQPLPPTPSAAPTIKALGPVESWTVDAVVQWLNAHRLHRYAGDFRRRVVDGNMLVNLDRQQLRELINDRNDRQRLHKALSSLKAVNNAIGSANCNKPPSPKIFISTPPSAATRGVQRPVFNFPETATEIHKGDSLTPRTAPHIFYARRKRWLRLRPEERLRAACAVGNMNAVERLLRQYPNKHVDRVFRGGDWKTPLFLAAEAGFDAIVRLLLEEGANPFKRTAAGITPVQAAAVKGYHNIVAILHGTEAQVSRSSFSSIGSCEAPSRTSPVRSAHVVSRLAAASTGSASPPIPPRSIAPASPRSHRRGLPSPRSTRKVGALAEAEHLVRTQRTRVPCAGVYEMPQSPLSQRNADVTDSALIDSHRSQQLTRSHTDSPVPQLTARQQDASVLLQTVPPESIYYGEKPRRRTLDMDAVVRLAATEAWPSSMANGLSASHASDVSIASAGSSSPARRKMLAERTESTGSSARMDSFSSTPFISSLPSPTRPVNNCDKFVAVSSGKEPLYVGVF
jgi:protein-tyrosine-phosphatase